MRCVDPPKAPERLSMRLILRPVILLTSHVPVQRQQNGRRPSPGGW